MITINRINDKNNSSKIYTKNYKIYIQKIKKHTKTKKLENKQTKKK